jgi:hypothetical protein
LSSGLPSEWEFGTGNFIICVGFLNNFSSPGITTPRTTTWRESEELLTHTGLGIPEPFFRKSDKQAFEFEWAIHVPMRRGRRVVQLLELNRCREGMHAPRVLQKARVPERSTSGPGAEEGEV